MPHPLIAVLRRLTSAAFVETVLGDLEERRHMRGRGRAIGAAWFWREFLAITMFALAAQVARPIRVAFSAFPSRGAIRELRHTARSLRRSPWYAASAVSVTALGMALATTVFAVVDGILFKPLPYPSAHQLFVVRPWFHGLDHRVGAPAISARDLADWRRALPNIQLAGLTSNEASADGGLALTQRINEPGLVTAEVDPAFFDTVGIGPMLGGFSPESYAPAPSTSRPVIVSFPVWQTRFGGDPQIIGRRVVLDDTTQSSIQVVGVMPAEFTFPGRARVDALMPAAMSTSDSQNPRRRVFNEVIVRVPDGLAPDVVRQRIEAAMANTAAAFSVVPLGGWAATEYTRFSGPFDEVALVQLGEYMSGHERPIALAVFIAAATLVLLACVNLSGLMLARGQHRGREIAIRRALGADGLSIARLVLLESLVVTTIGASIGLAAAAPLLRLTLLLLPETLHLLKTPAIDWRVVAFVGLAAALSAILAATWPIRQLLETDVTPRLHDGTGARQGRSSRTGFSRVVVATEVAVGLALTLAGTLLIGSLMKIWSGSVGFDTSDVVAIHLRLAIAPSRGGADVVAQLLAQVRRVPGVVSAGVTDAEVLQHASWGNVLARPPGRLNLFIDSHAVTSGFFEVMRPTLVDGHYPSPLELDQSQLVVVVGERVARAYWPGQRAVGQTLEAAGKSFVVVGVVEDARYGSWDDAPRAVVYGPYAPFAMAREPNLMLKLAPGASSAVGEVLRVVVGLQPSLRAIRVETVGELLAGSIRPRRFQSWLFGSFAVAALVIVGVGMFGLLAMTTARRTREIGILMAMGATRDRVVRTLVSEQFMSVAAGLAAGGLFSAWAVRFLRSYTYEITVYDPMVWLIATSAIVATAVGGTLLPSLRASRVDPVKALRSE